MKSRLRLIGIILLVTIIGLSAAACAKNPFIGTWTASYWGIPLTMTFADKTFTMSSMGSTDTGTYTRNGNSATLTFNGLTETVTITGNTFTYDDFTFTKQ